MKTMRALVAVVAGLGALCSGQAAADVPPPAFVHAELDGQGFLMTHLGRCILVTAAHVIGSLKHADLVGAGVPLLRGEAALRATDPADIAILDVTGPVASRCGSDFIRGAGDASFAGNSTAVITLVDSGGLVARAGYRVPVVDIDTQQFEVGSPLDSKEPLLQGFSGATVSIDDRAAGMFMTIHSGSHTGGVIRYDALMNIVFKLLDASATVARPSNPIAAPALGNLASADLGARVANWSTPPSNPEFAASNLLRASGVQIWEVPLAKPDPTIDIELTGARVQSIHYVEIQQGRAPTELLLKSYAVLGSVDGQDWFFIKDGKFDPGETASWVDFPPKRARFVRIRVTAGFDPKQEIAAAGQLIVR
jgi:hypothetical protein